MLAFIFRSRWGWLALGLIALVGGATVIFTAHAAVPTEISGTISSYKEFTDASTGAYHRNELQIHEKQATYTVDKTKFHPALPESVINGGNVDIWVDQGTTTVIAMTLYDDTNANPTKYTTDYYDHPGLQTSDTQRNGGIIGGIGVLFLLIAGFWSFLPGVRNKSIQTAKAPAMAPVTSEQQGDRIHQ